MITLKFFKLMIFMIQMKYNAPKCMYVFQNLSGGHTPGPSFGAGTKNRLPFHPKFWLGDVCVNHQCRLHYHGFAIF